MKKVLSFLAVFFVLNSALPAFACTKCDCNEHKMPHFEQIQHEKKLARHNTKKPPKNDSKQLSKIITGAAAGAIIASFLS